jgi:transposase-like protein
MYQNRHRVVDVAIEMRISTVPLNNWLKRYQLEGLEGLHPKRDIKVKENGKEELERLRTIEKKYDEAPEDIEILEKF